MHQALKQPLPVLEMDGIVLNARVEGFFEAVLAEVFIGEHPKGLVEGISVGSPQRPQLRDGVDAALVRFVGLHKLLVRDVQKSQYLLPLLPVLADEVEDGLAEVLDHVLGLSLLLLLIIFLFLEVADLLLGRVAVALEVVGLGLFGVVDEVGLFLGDSRLLVVVLVPVGAGAEDLEMIEPL